MTEGTTQTSSRSSPFAPRHPWQVLCAGIASLVLTVGLARFAYTPLLPLMQAQAGLSESMGGWLATLNYAGYMTGALIASAASRPALRLRLYRLGLLAGLIGTGGMGLTSDPVLWMVLRFIAGASAAAGLLLASGMVLGWLVAHGRRPELGLHFSGIGTGIVVSGVLVALMTPAFDWAQQWQVMGAVGLALLVPAFLWMPAPQPPAATAPAAAAPSRPSLSMWLLIASYFFAGIGFVITATFLVAATEKQPALVGTGFLVWIVVGLTSIPATFAWDRIARRIGEVPAMIVAYVLQGLSSLLPVMSAHLWAALGGAVLFGVTFIGIVSLMLTLVGKRNSANPSQAMARLTLSYGVAQIVAPALVGTVAEKTGNYDAGLWLAALAMFAGAAVLAAYIPVERRRAATR
ncbi:MAG: YbfB/YjiJ family MFS transporter [Aquamicrobium sp.]|uniref:YbfB/YjiJ family MFS transporter n=1 Tax=Aquamicrobium sp. TaxID=1872579 RepID=UPI00349E9D81|nr:YbfB/YjiJ family MFS transporter [Aquamicrobium sp.]